MMVLEYDGHMVMMMTIHDHKNGHNDVNVGDDDDREFYGS